MRGRRPSPLDDSGVRRPVCGPDPAFGCFSGPSGPLSWLNSMVRPNMTVKRPVQIGGWGAPQVGGPQPLSKAEARRLRKEGAGPPQVNFGIARALANDRGSCSPTSRREPRLPTGDAILALLYRLWEEEALTVVLITHDAAIARTAPRLARRRPRRLRRSRSARPMTRWTVRVVVVAVAAVVVIVIATAGSGADSSGDPEATVAGPDPGADGRVPRLPQRARREVAPEVPRRAPGRHRRMPAPPTTRPRAGSRLPGAQPQDPARARGLLGADAHAGRRLRCRVRRIPAGLGRCRPSSSSTTSGTVEAANAPVGGAAFALRLPTDGAAPA